MKRLLTALFALVLCAGPVSAKGLVVYDGNAITSGLGLESEQASYDRVNSNLRAALTEMLDRTGADYVMIPSTATKTLFVGTGQQVWNYGTSAATVESFDWVIHLNYNGTNLNALNQTTYRPESLFVSGKRPTVPQLFLLDAGWAAMITGSLTPSGGFTTGVAGFSGGATSNLSIVTASGNRGWFNAANMTRYTLGSNANGVRLLLQAKGNAMGAGADDNPNGMNTSGIQCVACDSVLFQDTDPDTAVMWEIPFTSTSGAKPIIFANYFGASTCSDSAVGTAIGCEGDPSILLFALARLDSLSNGGVFSRSKLPIKASIVIEGGFNRSGRRHPGGISPSDTTSLKATLDSLAALSPSPRLAVTVDVDSIANYTSEKTWWAKLPKVKFIPYTRLGRDTAAAGLGTWKFIRPTDPFGRFRTRHFVGPDSTFRADGAGSFTVNNQDSSVVAGIRSMFFRADSVFGRENVSRFLVAPDDDWSPKNMRWTSSAWDSLLYALQLGGAVGILADAQRPEASPDRIAFANRDLVRGWVQRQGYYRSKFGGRPVKLLAHSGYPILGGHSTWMQQAATDGSVDSIPPYETGHGSGAVRMFMPSYELNRFWNQLFMNNYRDVDYMPEDVQHNQYDDVSTPRVDRFSNIQRGYVYKLHANDFGGDATRPARPGYWIVKSIVNCFAAINEQAQRTVIELDWPENVEP